MRRKEFFLEESVLFISIIKWFFLASCIGVIVGISTSYFIKILNYSINITAQYKYYFLILPVALFLSSLLIKYMAPQAKGHGTEKVIEAIHKRNSKIDAMTVPIKLVTTVMTIAAGGSAGKEGPAAQIGAGLSSIFASIFRFNSKDRKKLVICGISAGFASVFGTPIAGAFFGVEVLAVGHIFYDVIFPSFVAGIISHQVSSGMGVEYFYKPLEFIPQFSKLFFVEVLIGALFFGFCSLILIESLKATDKLSKKIDIWEPFKGLIGGGLLIVLAFMTSTKYLGLGLDTIHNALSATDIYTYDFLLKILFTCITLAFCGSGGMVTPIFFIGATAGSFYAYMTGQSPSTFAAIGMVSVLAGAANTPLAASIMAIEFFGPQIAPYAALSCIVSYLMTGHRSVYPSQMIATTKSPSILIDKDAVMENMDSLRIKPRPRSIVKTLIYYSGKLMEKFDNFRSK
ncbi:MAG: chloride channel protein [Nitrospira sp.]|nr:chloride channel protein [Nitrospira sp.]